MKKIVDELIVVIEYDEEKKEFTVNGTKATSVEELRKELIENIEFTIEGLCNPILFNVNSEFVFHSFKTQIDDKLDNLCESGEISEKAYEFLKSEENKARILDMAEAFYDNGCYDEENDKYNAVFDEELIKECYPLYDETKELGPRPTLEEIINLSQETKNRLSDDSIYNADAFWMTVIRKAFPKDIVQKPSSLRLTSE